MAPATQKGLIVPQEKADFKLVDDWPVPTPGPRDVFIKIISSALNPADWIIQSNGHPMVTKYPITMGIEGAGVVEEIGSEVTTFVKGDKV